jgi:predicted GNAT family acetyltransferase
MSRELAHEPDAHRYTLRDGGELACVVDYSVLGDAISLTRTFTQPHLRGRGYAADLVEFVVDDIAATTSSRIVPMCWYVGEWFDRHPERADLLTR